MLREGWGVYEGSLPPRCPICEMPCKEPDEGGFVGLSVETVGKEKIVHTEDTILCCRKGHYFLHRVVGFAVACDVQRAPDGSLQVRTIRPRRGPTHRADQ